MKKPWLLALILFLATGPLAAQEAVPEFRYIVTNDVDFYGDDLDALFDTDLASCARACTAREACGAFTFNGRSNACFPKSDVSERQPYEGAVSARKIWADRGLQESADQAWSGLGLPREDLDRAREQARDLGFRHRAGGQDLDVVLNAARARADAGDWLNAMRWTGAAVVLTDRSDLWTEYTRLLMQTKDKSVRNGPSRAVSAALNGYLRAPSPGAQASALLVLAQALEWAGRGRDTIPVLRRAETLQPREDVLSALDGAIAKFGFRVTDSQVESDAAAPRICAEFSEPLVGAGVDYASYVKLPDPTLVVQAKDRQLCVDGVSHGTRYQITLRQGLPAASGETLYKDVALALYVRDRTPSVRFPGRSYVLPRTGDAAIPVETVNLTTLDLTLRRVSDRNLLRSFQDGYFGRPLSTYQDQVFASEIAQEVWTGHAEVGSALNRDVTTRLPIAEVIAAQPTGIYALTARVPGADPYDDAGATQWFILSDLGLSTAQGTDGLSVWVRGLGDTRPKSGVQVSLISQANAVLGTTTTDAQGFAHFEPGLTRGTGGAAPALVFAEDDLDDAGFLSLTAPAFDLSDRGVEGRAPAGPVDVFLTTDRGAYRAGEMIHATALARTGAALAVNGLPLTAILIRPDGVEYAREVSDGGQAGGHVFAMRIADTAPRGTWQLEIKADPKAPALARQSLLVEDLLPERIDFDLSLPNAPIRVGDTPQLEVSARYLFGAPGADLSIEGEVRLSTTDTVAGLPGYRFGRHDERPDPRSTYFGDQRTDADGSAIVLLELPELESAGQPMQLDVTVRLADGSARPVERDISAPVQPSGAVIGIKPLFADTLPENAEALFEIVGLDPNLQATEMQVRWTLNRIETRYQWYQLYGDWNWEPTTRRTRIATGDATLDAPLQLSQPVEWGDYELVVERLDGQYTATSVGFSAGWFAAADAAATPDRLELSLDRALYAPGDEARLRIVSQSAGTALISVMSNELIDRRVVEVQQGENLVPIEVTEAWGPGAYVSATVLRTMDLAADRNPSRALGIAYAAVDPGDKALEVAIDSPVLAAPRQSQPVSVSVSGAKQGQQVWVTLAAVDVGILNLTGFQNPDPQAYYFGQRRLGMELRDVYGRLIDGMNGAMGQVRSGGDANAGLRRQSPPPTQDLMAQFSGPVQVDSEGKATVVLDLPAFNGTVRLMAIAWSEQGVGQANADMVVRDPVVVTAQVPRFLAPGDHSLIGLEFVHADGPAGSMPLEVTAGDELRLSGVPESVLLDDEGKVRLNLPVEALTVGDPRLQIALTTPDGKVLSQTLRLPVRSNDAEIAQTRRFSLAAGDAFLFSRDVFAGMQPGTGSALLSAGPLARFDAPGLLTALDRYPYGCTEQVTSQALPLLYLSAEAQAIGLGNAADLRARVQEAITQILARQTGNGAFGLWRAEAGDFWLDAYVTDFLSRARIAKFGVPDRAFASAIDNLRNRVNYAADFDFGGEAIAYALMVLAREGAASMGDLRYYADEKAPNFATPLALAQLGTALASYGDQTRADALFRRAAQQVQAEPGQERPVWRADYGTTLRDTAGVLALATEARSSAVDVDALTTRISAADGRFSTQEAAWALLAVQALVATPEQSGLLANGVPVQGPLVKVLDDDPDAEQLSLTSADGQTTEITLTVLGIPEVDPPAGGFGYALRREYYTLDGAPLETSTLPVGERVVAVLTVTPFEDAEARLMVDDPLPAGLEIDNPNLLRSGDVAALDWLSLSEADHVEFRSDRFLAAVDLRNADGPLTLAYIVRAVTQGQYHHPAAKVEDMYRPRYRAWTGTGQMTVSE